MPFKKTHQSSSFSSGPLFIGRTKELLFFAQHILKPEEPTYNILSIWGQGGVGKTTLLRQFKQQAEMPGFKEYCLTAVVDERQTTPASIMEKFAQQLHLSNKFEKALSRYREALQLFPASRGSGSLQQTMVRSAPDIAGALVEGIPVAGPLLREGAKVATEHLLDHNQIAKEHSEAVNLDGPLETLTQIFLSELNQMAATKVTFPTSRIKRERRILLFFDTFEQVADEVVPWLLHYVLAAEINPNIVFVFAGRHSIERSTAASLKLWLPYYDDHTIYKLPLHSFTYEETTAYLAERGIITKERINPIWQLSQGLPLYLGLLVSTTQETPDPTKDVVDNFLHHIPLQEQTKRQLVLDASLFSRPFNLDDLEAFSYFVEQERPALYEWLLRQPFVRASSLDGRYVYHDVAQELFQRHLFQTSPKAYFTTRRALATHYQHQLEYLQTVQEKNYYGPSQERLEVMLALTSQLFLLPDEESHFQALSPLVDIWEYEDAGQVYMMHLLLRKMIHPSTLPQTSPHAYQVAQTYLYFTEIQPTMWDHIHKHEWLAVMNQLLMLIKHASPELIANIYQSCGWGFLRLREYQQARVWFERALALYPDSAKIQNGVGWMHGFCKDYQQSLDHFNYGLELAPYHPHLYIGRGKTYRMIKSYQQALSDFGYAIELDKSCLTAYGQRAGTYFELKDYQRALNDWDYYLEVAPEHPQTGGIQFQRGCIYLWLKELQQATFCFTYSYELATTQDSFSWARDFVFWSREWAMMCQTFSSPQSVQNLKAIGERKHYTAYVCRGVIFFLQKEFQQALTTLQHATTLRYDEYRYMNLWVNYWREWDAPFWLSMVYFALDQEEEARKAIAQALAFDMPPILLKPLRWFEQDKPELYKQLIKPLLDSYGV